MKKINFKKSEISIKNIGELRFWLGIIAGLISATTISILLNRFRELIRLLSSLKSDLLIFEKKELLFFNTFFVSLSTVLGLSITIWVWMGNPINRKKKHKIYKLQSRTNTKFIFWIILFLTAQLGCLFLYFSLGISTYDYPINLYKDYKIIFIFIPIVIFLQSWFSVRRIYKAGKWIFFSFFLTIIASFILYPITTVNQDKLNHIYYNRFKKEYEYIELEKIKSESKYGIKYDLNTITNLKQWYTINSTEQVLNIKKAFSKKSKVTIDTIVLQKIIIHNQNTYRHYRYYSKSRPLANWTYPLPEDILTQISYFETNSYEINELYQILKEIIILVNKSEIELNDYGNYLDSKKFDRLQPKVNAILVEKLIETIDSLKKVDKYADLNKILPKIKNVP